MSIQSILAVSAASLASLYFIRGAFRDLSAPEGGTCGKCRPGGCPGTRKG